MINAEVFLANLRNSYPVPVESQHLAAEDFPELPRSVVHALNRGWALAPVFAHSHSASIKRSMAGFPTTDPVSLVSLAREYPKCNWAVETGNGLLILEVNTLEANNESFRSLRQLCQGAWQWRRTLEFRCGPTHFFAFHHAAHRVRFLGNQFPGLKLHWHGSPVLLPPSWFVYGPPVVYASDPEIALLDAPLWLID